MLIEKMLKKLYINRIALSRLKIGKLSILEDFMKHIPRGVWQIAVLMLLHFTADMVGGILTGILPVIQKNFNISLATGVIFLASRSLSSNFCQIAVGPVRKNSSRPFFIYIGLLLLMLIGLFGFLPADIPSYILIIIAVFFGCGTAVVHPEGLRGAMAVRDVNGATATALFMTTGFFGASCGPLLGALLVERSWGMKNLIFIVLFLLIVMGLIFTAHIKLLTDKKDQNTAAASVQADFRWGFIVIFLIALFMNSGTTFFHALLPTFLHDKYGFSLKTGGFAVLLFGLGSATGSVIGGILAKKIRPSSLTMFNLLSGVIFIMLYLPLSCYQWSIVILFFAGLTVSSSLPLLVVMARFAPAGIAIGLKMGMIVGGTWGGAGIILMILGTFIEKIGLLDSMYMAGGFYCAALLIAGAGALCRRRSVQI